MLRGIIILSRHFTPRTPYYYNKHSNAISGIFKAAMIAHSLRPYGDSVDYFLLPCVLCRLVYGWPMHVLNRTGARGIPSGPQLLNYKHKFH